MFKKTKLKIPDLSRTPFPGGCLLVCLLASVLNTVVFAGSCFGEKFSKKDVPHFKEIDAIIRPLKYSSLNKLLDDSTQLGLDFNQKTWSLTDVFHYDQDGNVLLYGGNEGLCEELTGYTYQKIKKILGDEYRMDFVKVSETAFFTSPKSSHFAILVSYKRNFTPATAYIIDPSFHVAGPLTELRNYYLHERLNKNNFLDVNKRDLQQPLNSCRPILIRKNHLLNLCVNGIRGRFDAQNFVIELKVKQKHEFAGTSALTIRRADGRVERIVKEKLLKKVLTKQEKHLLEQRLLEWSHNMSLSSYAPARF